MFIFLLQTINNEISFDFIFHIKEAIRYNNWFYNKKVYDYVFCENIDDNILKNINKTNMIDISKVIPIGSVEFVLKFYKKFHHIENIKPINIPEELNKFEFLQRKIFKGNEKNIISGLFDKNYFIKDISGFKKLVDIVSFSDIPDNENFLVSEEIDILSEWRCFIYNKKLLDLKNYLQDCFVYPNVEIIQKMIKEYKNSPQAYTLDIAITNKEKTVLLEVHQFFSVGLYGFADYRVLPNMFISTHKEILG